jgi:hypothetical protein
MGTTSDFRPGQDKIDLSDLCTTLGNDVHDVTFIGTAPFSGTLHYDPVIGWDGPRDVPPELRYEQLGDGTTVIQIDGPIAFQSLKLGWTPLDGRVDGSIILMDHHDLSASDFIL